MSSGKGPPEDAIPDVDDSLIWSCALARLSTGDVSLAVTRANSPCEDSCEVGTAPFGAYVGIYDGHGGPQASSFLNEHLFSCMTESVAKAGGVTTGAIQEAIGVVEAQFLDVVRANWRAKPQYASVGSCVLLGLLAEGTLHLVSLGDSLAVLVRRRPLMLGGGVAAERVSIEHNASNSAERDELRKRFPFERGIVVQRSGVWRVKGIIQVTRSIGDFYLKFNEFQKPPLNPRFLLPGTLKGPALLSRPSIRSIELRRSHLCCIFASDGLWEHVKPKEACSIVAKYPRMGIARRLVKLAVFRGCRAQGRAMTELLHLDPAGRRQVHDDISVAVLFFDHDRTAWASAQRGGGSQPGAGTAEPLDGVGGTQEKGAGRSGGGTEFQSLKGLSEFTPAQLRRRLTVDNVDDSFLL